MEAGRREIAQSRFFDHHRHHPTQQHTPNHNMTPWLRFPVLLICLTALSIGNVRWIVEGWETCSNGDLCPTDNTCCPGVAPTTTHRPSDWTVSKSSSSSCITGKHAGKGVCCYDTAIPSETSTTDTSSWIGIPTGCAEGFECAQEYINNAERSFCRKVDVNKTDAPDQVPRYRLCSLSVEALTRVYGLPVIPNPKLFQASRDYPQLAYVSTAGPLDSNDRTIRQRQAQTETILIVIHGSGRNVQDYLCAMTAAVPPPLRETTLVLAPWFRTPQDAPVSLYNRTDDMHPLQWAELGPIFHTWRYGADAINPVLVQHHKKVSSYAVLDTLLTQYVQQVQNERFPRLQRIIVAGHSAGDNTFTDGPY